MRFVGRGHGEVRATHDRTLELIGGSDLTARGTCIVAVDTVVESARALAGPVQITLCAGSSSFTLDAVANPSWTPGGPVVVRRGPARLPGTFATEASAASADLPRDLVGLLRDPATTVTATVSCVPTDDATVVLFLADAASAADARLDAEVAVADVVLAEDADALRLVGRHTARPGRRTLVVATRELPGRSAAGVIGAAARLETVGLTPALAVAACCPATGPLTVDASTAAGEVVRSTPPAHRLVLAVDADDVAGLLALAARVRGTSTAVIAQEHAPPRRVVDGEVPGLPNRSTVHVCLPPAAATTPAPQLQAAITGLLADGVPTKTAAKALAALTGWERRRAYDTVLDWRGGPT